MQKISWALLEDWATAKAIKFGMSDDWVDLVMWIVAKRAQDEHKLGRYQKSPLGD